MFVYENINEDYKSFNEIKELSDEIYSSIRKDWKNETLYNIKDAVKNINDYSIIKDFINSGVGFVIERIGGEAYTPSKNYETSIPGIENYKKLRKEFPIGIIWFSGNINSIIHELQHAYDDWRSKGKALNKYSSKNVKFAPIDKATKETKKYFQTDFELSAYFMEVLTTLTFLDNKGNPKEFEEVWENFKRNFTPWLYLSNEKQKKYSRKFYQYYKKIII